MKKNYIAIEMKIKFFMKQDVVTTSDLETGVPFDDENWGTGGSWMNDTNA